MTSATSLDTSAAETLAVAAASLIPTMTTAAEAVLTTSRPLGEWEIGLLLARRGQGLTDSYSILIIEGPHVSIDRQDVAVASAVLRIRHPILAARVSFTAAHPEFVCMTPLTKTHAIKESASFIEFNTFEDVQEEAAAIRDLWISRDPTEALDIRTTPYIIRWSKGIGASEGKYILGFQTTHFSADGRGRLRVLRHFMELLADPVGAQEELSSFYASTPRPLSVPVNLEKLMPSPTALDGLELEKAKQAYGEYMKLSTKVMIGLTPDGTPEEDKALSRLVLHTWSHSDTLNILRACKAHGVSITHVATAAMAIAALPSSGGQTSPDASYAMIFQAVDLSSRLQPSVKAAEHDTITRTSIFPVFLELPQSATNSSQRSPAVWSLAKQSKDQFSAFLISPYFWHFIRSNGAYIFQDYMGRIAGKPGLPLMSSMGDCSHILPSDYPVHSPVSDASGGSAKGQPGGGTLHIMDMSSGMKPDILSDTILVRTYNGQLHLRLTHNGGRTSPALMDPYFKTVIQIISEAGTGTA